MADVESASTDWWNYEVASVTSGDMDVRISIYNTISYMIVVISLKSYGIVIDIYAKYEKEGFDFK